MFCPVIYNTQANSFKVAKTVMKYYGRTNPGYSYFRVSTGFIMLALYV